MIFGVWTKVNEHTFRSGLCVTSKAVIMKLFIYSCECIALVSVFDAIDQNIVYIQKSKRQLMPRLHFTASLDAQSRSYNVITAVAFNWRLPVCRTARSGCR